MSTLVETPLLTPDQLAAHPDEKDFELIDGELKKRKVSVLSSWVGSRVSYLLSVHVDTNNLGWVFGSDNGFQCFPDSRRTVRRPDVSFVRSERFSLDDFDKAWLRVVPDLVVEVISPNDLWLEVEQKVKQFQQVGVPLIWVINPVTRTVRIVRGDGSIAEVGEGEELSGEAVIPGFSCPVSGLFPPRPLATPVTPSA